ncbi:hypothetical protein BH10PSE6_BH10PSE6_40320 [soil metagenome]
MTGRGRYNTNDAPPQTDKKSILVVLSVAKDPAERSDTGRVAGVRSFAPLRTTGNGAQASKAVASTIDGLSWKEGLSTRPFGPWSR